MSRVNFARVWVKSQVESMSVRHWAPKCLDHLWYQKVPWSGFGQQGNPAWWLLSPSHGPSDWHLECLNIEKSRRCQHIASLKVEVRRNGLGPLLYLIRDVIWTKHRWRWRKPLKRRKKEQLPRSTWIVGGRLWVVAMVGESQAGKNLPVRY